MKIVFTFFFVIFTCNVFSQSKTELIQAITQRNIFDSEEKGLLIEDPTTLDIKTTLPSKGDNFANFKALVSLINHDDLIALTKNENPILRMFSIRELFQQENSQFDFLEAFKDEVDKNIRIENQLGCEITQDYTCEILHSGLISFWRWNQALDKKYLDHIDSVIAKIDSYCLFNYDRINDETIFESIFERQVFDLKCLKIITQLLFEKDNFYAFQYIEQHYPNEFEKIKTEYLKDNFKTKKFDIENHSNSFCEFVNYAKQTANQKLYDNLIGQYEAWDEKDNFLGIGYRVGIIK